MSFNQYRPGGFFQMPVVTKNIILISVILFGATYLTQNSGSINLFDYLGLHHHLAPVFKPHQFVTYIFMHGSLMHIFFNMFGVYIFGQALEQVWGPKRYLIFYILTGLGAALVQYVVMHLEISNMLVKFNAAIDTSAYAAEKAELIGQKFEYLNDHVIVGASGSLFGLLGGFGMLFPNRYLYLYFLFPVKAKWFVTFYGLAEIFSGLQNNPMDNVAHFAHIGGLAVGVILVLLWRKDREHFY